MRKTFVLVLSFAIVGCGGKDVDQTATTKPPALAKPVDPDTAVYEETWNIGQVSDEPEENQETRFQVRVTQLSSGKLSVFLDSAPLRSGTTYSPADSVKIEGLTPVDHFTRGCKYGSGPWRQTIGVVRDTVYERFSRPQFIWVFDTVTARIQQLPKDSASCMIGSPE